MCLEKAMAFRNVLSHFKMEEWRTQCDTFLLFITIFRDRFGSANQKTFKNFIQPGFERRSWLLVEQLNVGSNVGSDVGSNVGSDVGPDVGPDVEPDTARSFLNSRSDWLIRIDREIL